MSLQTHLHGLLSTLLGQSFAGSILEKSFKFAQHLKGRYGNWRHAH